MFKVGLTGGIGSGKTTVLELFKKLSVPVLDADLIARQLVEKGQPALVEIAQAFGDGILMSDGSLDRARLREIVFSDTRRKRTLEAIIHPLVFQTIETQLKQLTAPYCIICIPLLFETNQTDFVDRILVVDCPVEIQIERVKKRDKLPVKLIKSIIDSQVSRAYRLEKSDDIIDNSTSEATLAERVKNLHNLYFSLSKYQDNIVCDFQHHL